MNPTCICPTRVLPDSLRTPIVFVIDSNASVRGELASVIRSIDCEPITAASAEDFIARPRMMATSCLFVECHLPGMSGLELQKLLLERTEMPIVFMSEQPDVRSTVQAMKAGAFEFLIKPLATEAVLSAIAGALEHSRAMLPHAARGLALQQRYESLSRREREVMDLVVCGRLNKQVGSTLGISEITVKAHRGRVMRKMQAASVAELVNMAARLRRNAPVRLVNVEAFARVPGHDVHVAAMAAYGQA